MRLQEINNKIHELIESAYMMGYEDGKNLEYDLGLNDAWECARKMMLSDEDGGIALSDIQKIFSMTPYSAMKSFSASEAIAKLKEYEEKQKRNCDTCKYGGHTLQDLKKCVYCDGSYYWTPKKMTLDEAIKHCEEVADSKCDECGAEHRQLAEWLRELKQIKGEEE
jgi:hypothetical protein